MDYRHFVLVDKPSGLTSSGLVREIREIYQAKKAGHTGTLDTGTTGLMIVGLDEALKAMPLLDRLDKEYEGTMVLHREIGRDELARAARKFTGSVEQLPPRRSAVRREPRTRHVFYFKFIKSSGRRVVFRTGVEAGTYVRKLCHDMGRELGTGANMEGLRRISIGNIPVSDSRSLEHLKMSPKPALVRVESLLARTGSGRVTLKRDSMEKVRSGTPLDYSDLMDFDRDLEPGELIGIFSPPGGLLAIGRVKETPALGKNKIIRIDRVLNTKP